MAHVETLGIVLGVVSVALGIAAILLSRSVARAAAAQTAEIHTTAEAARVGVDSAVGRLERLADDVAEALHVHQVERKTANLEDFIAEWLLASSRSGLQPTIGSLRHAVARSRFHLIDLEPDLLRLRTRNSLILHGPPGDPNTRIDFRLPPG